MENALLKKLQIKECFKVKVVNAPSNFLDVIGDDGSIVFNFDGTTSFSAPLIFAITKVEMAQAIQENLNAIRSNTITWILYPKAKTKLANDLNLMQSSGELKNYGLTSCASKSVNETWTALRIKPEIATKRSGQGNTEIIANEYGNFIDVQNKTVTIPSDLKVELERHGQALTFFNQLAYSNKKEYVIWILTAKQEKTRLVRIQKTIDKVLAGKKNPSD